MVASGVARQNGIQNLMNFEQRFVVILPDGSPHPSVNRTAAQAQAVLEREGGPGWRVETWAA